LKVAALHFLFGWLVQNPGNGLSTPATTSCNGSHHEQVEWKKLKRPLVARMFPTHTLHPPALKSEHFFVLSICEFTLCCCGFKLSIKFSNNFSTLEEVEEEENTRT